MLISIFFEVLLGESKVYEEYLWVCIQVSIGIDHDILKLEVIERSFWLMHVLENLYQLGDYVDDFLNFFHSFEFA